MRWFVERASLARQLGSHPHVTTHVAGRVDWLPHIEARGKGPMLVLRRRARRFARVGVFLEEAGARVEIGERTFRGRRTEIITKQAAKIGDDNTRSWDVLITDTGVEVGVDAILATKSVVTRLVAARAVVAGDPAREIVSDSEWQL